MRDLHAPFIAELASTNASSLPHYESFRSHRERLTELVARESAGREGPRLCVLGAGNCYDLDLDLLSDRYSEIHLVDLDESALTRARERQNENTKRKLFLHAPVDVSGVLHRLDDWRAMRVTPEELMACPDVASRLVAAALPAPFDVVASTCLLSQIQLAVLEALSDRHRLFEAVRQIVNLVHLRTLTRLLEPGGSALLVSDFASNATYPLDRLPAQADLAALGRELISAGNVIHAVNPELIAWAAREDPFLLRHARLSPARDVWLWQNGPERVFLVYALSVARAA